MTYIRPPPVASTMAIGFTPYAKPKGGGRAKARHVVLLTTNVAVLMVLMDPEFGHAEFAPLLRTYITPLWVELRATGCEPLSRLMVVMVSLPVKKYWLTVSLPPLDTNSAPSEGERKASKLEPNPMVWTRVTLSPETLIWVVEPLPMGLELTTYALCVDCGCPPGPMIGFATGRYWFPQANSSATEKAARSTHPFLRKNLIHTPDDESPTAPECKQEKYIV